MSEGNLSSRRRFLRNLVAGALGAGVPQVADASGGNPNRTLTPEEKNETPPSAPENTTD